MSFKEATRSTAHDGSVHVHSEAYEAVKAFLPNGHDLAYVPEEALGLLTRFDRTAAHYEVLDHRQQPIRR